MLSEEQARCSDAMDAHELRKLQLRGSAYIRLVTSPYSTHDCDQSNSNCNSKTKKEMRSFSLSLATRRLECRTLPRNARSAEERKKKGKGEHCKTQRVFSPLISTKPVHLSFLFFLVFMIRVNEKQTNNQKAQSHTHTHTKKTTVYKNR